MVEEAATRVVGAPKEHGLGVGSQGSESDRGDHQ
jgi:hypothetical protein